MTAPDELVAVATRLAAAGLSPGSTGNLSVRVGDELICSPTGSRLADLAEAGLSVVSLAGEHRGGPRPTKETAMHRAMLLADDSLRAVVHLHSSFAAAFSCLPDLDPDDAIPALTPYLAMKGGPVKLIDYFTPGDAAIFAPIHASTIAGHHALLLAHHGSLVAGRTLSEAEEIAVELEEAAKMALITRGAGVRPLSAVALDELAAMRRRRLATAPPS